MTVAVPQSLIMYPFRQRNTRDWYLIYEDLRPSRTREEWLSLAKSYVGWKSEEIVDGAPAKLADMCLQAELHGENCSVWHQLSIKTGNQCHCAQCNPKGRVS